MRKIFLFCIVSIAFASCQRDDVATNRSASDYCEPCSKTSVRPLSEALNELDQTLDAIYTGTRANDIKSYSINNVRTYISNASTRSNTSVEIPDTLVYIVDFDNEGYAILGAQSNISPIFSITEQGAFDIDKFTEAINYEIENNILTAEEYERRVAEEENAEDIDISSTDEDFVYGLVASSVVGNIIDGPVIIDPTPVTPPLPTPDPPRVIGTDTTRYVEFLDYYPEMLTTRWHQKEPFNKLCKDNKDSICPAGCVVIALAQIMAYNEFPSNKTFNGVVVDWDLVKSYNNDYKYSDNHPVAIQLSNLCYELGKDDNCNIDYTPDGSSAPTWRARKTLDNYKYDNVDRRYGFGAKDREVTINMLKNNKPVYIDAARIGGAHAWVLDGYIRRRSVTKITQYYTSGAPTTNYSHGVIQNLVHCNFGWGGDHNGYYTVTNDFDTEHRYIDIDSLNMGYTPDNVSHRHYTYNFDVITYDL